MDKNKAIELLKQNLSRTPQLRQLKYDNQEFTLWKNEICDILEVAFGKNSTEYDRFARAVTMSTWSESDIEQQEMDIEDLNEYETALISIIGKHELLDTESKTEAVSEPKDSVKLPLHIFDSMQFHLKVIEASRKLFNDGHYRDAILRAFIEVNNFVKAKTGLELDGKALMTQVFRKENPLIKLNESKTQSEKDEQEGFMFLFMGAMIGIRNPKAHDNIIQTDPLRILEYLSLASLLMRRAEDGILRPNHLKS